MVVKGPGVLNGLGAGRKGKEGPKAVAFIVFPPGGRRWLRPITPAFLVKGPGAVIGQGRPDTP